MPGVGYGPDEMCKLPENTCREKTKVAQSSNIYVYKLEVVPPSGGFFLAPVKSKRGFCQTNGKFLKY